MKYYTLYILFFLSVTVFPQSVQLRGKVIDTDKNPVKNISVRLTSYGEALTTTSGEFVISIPPEVNFVDIVIKDTTLNILYPVDSKIAVPTDPNFVNTIIVSSNKLLTNNKLDVVVNRYNELEKLLKGVGSTNNELKSFFERFIEIESKRLEMSEMKLKEEFEKKKQRNRIYSDIAPVLQEYLLRVKNIKTNFALYSEQSFVSNKSVEHLNKAIDSYNPTYDTIYNNYRKWQNEISESWDESLSENFAASINYMIDEIHKPFVFQLNEDIRLINNVRLRIGEGASKPDELKEQVIDNVNNVLQNLEIKIPILDNRFKEIITRLQHSGFD